MGLSALGKRPTESRLSGSELDAILTIQLSVAWAGEEARCKWWKSDLVDLEGGGALFARLAPRTGAWASLILVHAAARLAEEKARAKIADADRLLTLFHLGFGADEQLADRLRHHRARRHVPAEVFGPRYLPAHQFTPHDLELWLRALGTPEVETTPAGRRLVTRAAPLPELAPSLAAALLPLGAQWPLPYFEVRD